MSLINQMLKDLDARHEAEARGRLHREVRALPQSRENRSLRLAVVGLLALTVAAAAWWGFEQYMAGSRLPQSEAVVATTPVAPPTAVAVAAPAPAADAVAQDVLSGLKLSALLDKPPSESPSARAVVPVTPPAQKRVAATNQNSGAVVASKSAATPDSPPSVAHGGADKTPVAKPLRERSDADYRRAVGLVNGARLAEATDLLLDVLRLDGAHVASRQLLARLLIEQRRNDEAAAILAEGLSAQPGQVTWAMTLARLQVDRGDLAGAARTLQQSQPFAVGNADYQGFAGHVQHRLGHEKEAVDFYQAAVRLAPADGRWWLGLGLALEADHRAAEAREAFFRARASGALNADLAAIVDQKLR